MFATSLFKRFNHMHAMAQYHHPMAQYHHPMAQYHHPMAQYHHPMAQYHHPMVQYLVPFFLAQFDYFVCVSLCVVFILLVHVEVSIVEGREGVEGGGGGRELKGEEEGGS